MLAGLRASLSGRCGVLEERMLLLLCAAVEAHCLGEGLV
jgi:hypothetical protein